ncbi:14359_t:CDS:2, partial [Racocetra persica]
SPCKHQAAVAIKYHERSFNFIPALSINDCMDYHYIACGTVAQDFSFYASLRAPAIFENNKMNMHNENTNAGADINHQDSNIDISTVNDITCDSNNSEDKST